MEPNRKIERQKIKLSLYSIKSNGEKELFGSWPIYIGQKYVIGRGKESDISIDSLLLSRKQIELVYYTDNLIVVKDLGSRNGTFINNVRLDKYQEIKFTSKDKLSFGGQNNLVEFHEYIELRKSIFDDNANGNIVHNKNINVNDNKRIEDNQLFKNRDNNNRYNSRINSLPQRNRNNLNESLDSADTEIRMKVNNQRNDNYNNNTYRRNQNSYRGNFYNRYRANYYNENNRRNYNEINQRYNDYNNKDNDKRFIGRKYGRNMNNRNDNRFGYRYDNRRNYNRYDNGMIRRKNYTQYQNQDLERIRKSLEKNKEEFVKNQKDRDEFANDLINLLNGKGNENNKITLKETKDNGLELVMPIKDKNLSELKKFKKTKLAVNGFLELELDK
jgi:pSer/pThr/pTyr-binding forkhead associated (FHA) protein